MFASALAIGPGGLVSYSPATRVGVHSLLAFWISIPAALVILAYMRKPGRPNILVMSVLVYSIVLHIGSAVKNTLILSQPAVERYLIDAVADMVDLAIFGVMIAGASICFTRQVPFERLRVSRTALPVWFLSPLIIYAAIWYFVLPALSVSLLILLSWILAGIAVFSFLIASYLIPKIKQDDLPIDFGYLVSATLLFAVSVIALLLTLPSPSVGWEFAETLQMAGFLLFCLALGIPYLRRNGFNRRSAYGFNIGMILIAYFPFLIAISIESMSLNYVIESQNLLAYSIIHFGAGALSGLMAILLYIYPKKKTSWNHYPLILIFGLWASVALFSIFTITLPSIDLLGEPITHYTIGSILTLVLLGFAIRWTMNPPSEEKQHPTFQQLAAVLAIMVIIIVFGEWVNQIVLITNPPLVGSPIGSILIQISNLIIMFAFSFLIFLLAAKSRGIASLELFVVISLAMWIIPNILKSYYTIWYTGWWVSEIYLFAGLLAITLLLVWLYVRSMHEVGESHGKASMYADLLMHDITNFNQMMMTSFELLGSEDTPIEQREKLSVDGCQVISLAEHLINNVRLLSETDRLKELQPVQTNLVSTIVDALDIFSERISTEEIVIEFKPNSAQAQVFGNDLLIHIFLNILYDVLDCYKKGENVSIELEPTHSDGQAYWQVEITTYCRKIEDFRKYSSSILGLRAARIITESLNGTLVVTDYQDNESNRVKLFTVFLPAVNK